MHIQYYGLSCVKLTTKPGGRGAADVTIVVNPFTRTKDLTPPQLGSADIIVAAAETSAYYSDAARGADAVAVTMPGEYAIKGVQIVGVDLPVSADTTPATAFIIESEGMKVAVVTATDTLPGARQFEEMNGAHVLIVAAGGNGVLSGSQAVDITRKIEPAFVIPVNCALLHNATTAPYASTDEFCDKIGTCPKETVPKVVLKAQDCADAAMHVVLMAPQK